MSVEDRESLAQAAQRGDRAAFERLVELDGLVAYRVILGMLDNGEDAQDALQDCLLAAWRQLPSLRRPESWSAWFRRIAMRSAVNVARARSRAGQRGGITEPAVADSADDVAQRDVVHTALSSLRPADRALLALRFAADLTIEDASAALQIPVGTAKSRLHRALHQVRRNLEATDER